MLKKAKTKKLRSKKFVCVEKEPKKETKWEHTRPVSFGSMPFDGDNIGENGFYI